MDQGAGDLPRLDARESTRGAVRIATIEVSDPLDPRVADYRNVPHPALLERHGLFVAEGRLVVRRLLTGSRFVTRSLMVTRAALDALPHDTRDRPDLPFYLVAQDVMNEIAGFNFHRGCLAIGERGAPLDWRRLAAGAPLSVLLERVGDADNVGSIFRNAAAFGAGTILLDSASADPLYRKAIRTSMGASLHLPFARLDDRLDAALRVLHEDGVATVALTPSPEVPCLQQVVSQLTNRRVTLVVGHEGDGLTQDVLDACDFRARIPMTAGVDSLNVATSAAIAMYELGRLHG